VPVDGELTDGKDNVDESMVTGEPIPAAKVTMGRTVELAVPASCRHS
jgi:P-type Cu+ transporter